MTKFLSSADERLTFDAKSLFFASDYHYGHAGIIQYCKRPYVFVDEMDQALSFGLQETVPHKGVMVFLGDLTFHTDPTKIDAQIHSLRAETKILVRGNHDGKEVAHSDKWDLVVDHLEIKVRFNGKTHRLFLSHYPHYSWPGSHHGGVHLHGHSHGQIPGYFVEKPNPQGLRNLVGGRLDISADCWDYRPVSFGQIWRRLEQMVTGEHDGRAPWAKVSG